MTFVGGDNDHYTLFYFDVEEFFTVLGCRYALILDLQ
jgi:hypothetical protein